MSEFPAPLTPAACDLQDFPFMPLHVARLRDSDLAAEASPEACWYAVLLWAASWHQLPAGSLPDNEAVLTRLLGLGRDVRTFRKHKDAAMRGFVLCNDGRLYHPVVAEQVIAAWDSKLQQRWRTECARIKKQNQRTGTDLPLPTFEEFMASGHGDPSPDIVPEDATKCPQGQTIQETGTGTGTGTVREDSEAKASARSALGQPDAAAWATVKLLLAERENLGDDASGKFFGQLLARNGLEARDMLPALASAGLNGTPRPREYLTKAAGHIAKRRTDQPRKSVGFV